MTSKQRTKLELIRIEGICRMLLSKINEDDLSEIVENVTRPPRWILEKRYSDYRGISLLK